MEGAPDFITQEDPNSSQLTIITDDLNDVGTYTFKVIGKIAVPNDYKKTSFTEWKAETEFKLRVSGVPISCESTVFDTF